MKILLYSGEFPPENGWGGIATYTYYMALGLSKAGHDVTVVAQFAPGSPLFSNRNGFRVYRYKKFNTHYYLSRLGLKSKKIIRFLSMLDTQISTGLAVSKAARLHGIEMVEYPDSYADGMLHKLFCGTPYIVKCHVPSFTVDQIYKSDTPELIRSIEMRFLRNASAVTSPSLCIAKLVRQKYGIASVRVVHNPVDTLDFPLSKNVGEYILFTGWISQVKGIDFLIKSIPAVVSRYPTVKFKLAGSPMDIGFGQSMRELAKQLDVENNIEWLGRVDRSLLPSLYQGAKFCVVPSRWENSPYTILEAFSSGKPVVATNVGGIPELIKDLETGILVKPEDSASLSRGIISLLEDTPLTLKLGRNARAFVEERHSLEVASRQTANVYEEILSTP